MRRHDDRNQSLLSPSGAEHHEAEAWRLGLVVLDDAFERARRALGEGVRCGKGCSHCCAGLFEIHAADAALLADGIAALPGPDRLALLERAREVVSGVERAAEELAGRGETALAGWRADDGLSTVPETALARLAEAADTRCPVLDASGACSLHAFRPAICRLQGVPWRDPETGWELPDGCRLDPRQAGHAPQPIALSALDEAREQERARLARASGGSVRTRTFVAQAVVSWGRVGRILGSSGPPMVSSADSQG